MYGVIIFPDGYTTPAVTSLPTGNKKFSALTTTDHTLTDDQWYKLESDGCVFLPAGGNRSNTKVTMSNYGNYWTATWKEGTNRAYYFYLHTGDNVDGYVNWGKNPDVDAHFGFSVRLVKDI